ncbi:MAG: branched-chain amino acid ABC transporter permease [Actinobacteria bacterium]|nr:MAG: branched-chain amino acid ABC transporter permease [Actinomycetota bacterium]
MHLVVQAVILGLLTGGVYALMASGLTLAFGVMRVINVAQGALIILSAYLTYTLFVHAGLDPFVALLVITPGMFVLGMLLQFVFIRPLRSEDREELSLLVTWAIALGIEGVLSVVFKTTYRSVNTGYTNATWDVGGYTITQVRFYGFLLSVAILGLLFLALTRTRIGRAIRAVVQNPVSARLLGIETERVAAVGFGLSAATASAAGAVYAMVYPFNPNSHYDLISLLLTIIVLGGLGSLGGAIVAALFMGVAEAVLAATISPTWAKLTFFVALLTLLLIRPQGLFGVKARGAI